MNPKDLQGIKKVPLTLIPTAALVEMAMCMKDGADKYGPFNWREKGKPVSIMIYIAAAQRHLLAYLDGEDLAPDSGRTHLGHAAASLAVLMDALAVGNVVDDRPEPGPAPDLMVKYAETDDFIDIEEALDEKCMGQVLDEAFEKIKVTGFPSEEDIKQFETVVMVPLEKEDITLTPTFEGIQMSYIRSLSGSPNVEVLRVTTGAPKCYLAGPMTGYDRLNFPAFDEHKEYLETIGYDVISPADLDRAAGINEFDYAKDRVAPDHSPDEMREIIRRDTDAILSLDPKKDAIALMPGWENSAGAVAEFFFARWRGLAVIDAVHGMSLAGSEVNFVMIGANMSTYLRESNE